MSSTLTCDECGLSEDVEIQANEPEMRVYLPAGDVPPEKDLALGFLVMADDAWFEKPQSGLVLCAECSAEIAGDEVWERDGDTLRMDMGEDDWRELADEN